MKNIFVFILIMAMANPVFAASVEKPSESLEVQAGEGIRQANDRDYFVMVRHLIASAQKTIDISMDMVSVEDDPKDPARTILNDLMAAAHRDVKIRFFLNTHTDKDQERSFFLRDDLIAAMRKERIEMHYVSPSYSLYDRLMIVDHEWVLEGGLRWARQDLEKGLGSATLTRSQELANLKRVRLELLPLWDVQAKKNEITDGGIPVPVYLMRDLKYFPGMTHAEDSDAIRIYLALLRHFYSSNAVRMSLSVEELVDEIPADQHFAAAESAFQVLKTLDRLEKVHELIKLEKKSAERVELTLILPQDLQPAVRVPVPFFQEGYAKQLSANAIFAYLVILLRSQTSGDAPVWLGSEKNVEQDFPLPREKFRQGIEELRRKNLVEVYPFKLQGKYSRLENLEYRYVVNPVTTLSEKLEIWTRLRDQYGDVHFKHAREMAEALGEDEDPKVIASYLELMEKFPGHNILSLTQHIASLSEKSTPERLDYLRELLEHEIPDTALAAG